MTDEPQLTARDPTSTDAHPPAGDLPVPPPALPPDDAVGPLAHGRALPASHPAEAYVPLRRWVLDSAAQLRAMRADLRQQLAASVPSPGNGDSGVPDNVVLVTSELATNALAHGRPPAEVHLMFDGHAVLIVVSDRDATHAPFLAEDRAPGEGGFGLQIARRLSDAVGWWTDTSGKHVWAAFEADAAA